MATKRISTGWRAFSLSRESAYRVAAIPNVTFNYEGGPADISPNAVQTDEKEITGYTEITRQDIINWTMSGTHKQRAMPQNIAFFASLVLGKCTDDQPNAGGDPAVYRHWVERNVSTTLMPSVTMVEYDGISAKQYVGVYGKSLRIIGERGAFINMEAALGGAGKEEASGISRPSVVAESYLRYGDANFSLGGSLAGSVAAGTLAVSGGTSFKADLKSFDYSVESSASPVYEIGDNSGYVARVERGDRWKHSLSASLEMQNDTHKTSLLNGTTYALNIPIIGSVIAGGSGTLSYKVNLIYPKVVYREAKKGVDGRVVKVDAKFEVLEDPTYGSVVIEIINKVPAYLS